MGIVDVEYEVYKCPHCPGYIILRKQFPYMDTGCSISVSHTSSSEFKLPTNEDIEIMEVEEI